MHAPSQRKVDIKESEYVLEGQLCTTREVVQGLALFRGLCSLRPHSQGIGTRH